MNLRSKFALAALAALLVCPLSASAIDKAEFEKAMDGYLENDANLDKMIKAFQNYTQKKQQEQMKASEEQESKKIEEQFKNPVKIDVGSSPAKGNPNAKVTVIEFSDFQCPFCSRGASVMEELLKAYPNDVKLVFKNLPLEFHPGARPAAKAALAANEQGKFWELYDVLFKNQEALSGELGVEAFAKLAEKANLDIAKFKADLQANDAKYEKIIKDDSELAAKLGIRGTPGFFVNGVEVRGARPLSYFKNIVDKWLGTAAPAPEKK